MTIALRIAIVVFGFALIIVAELIDNAHARKPYAAGNRRAETFFDDAKVFTLRIFGAVAIAIGLLSFVVANHLPAVAGR